MNTIELKSVPSPTSNDHQTRVFVDGEDWLGDDFLGLDPPDFFKQKELVIGGKVLVGRCDCGCLGCCDHEVYVKLKDDVVIWKSEYGYILAFDKAAYLEEIETKALDYSWEDQGRTAERILQGIFEGSVIENGYCFDWVSTRCSKNKITLSFSNNGVQSLKEFDWDISDLEMLRKTALQTKQSIVEQKNGADR